MSKVKDTNYLAITAMLAARETKMLSAERMERMIDAPTNDEAAKILEECGYGDLSGLSAKEAGAALEAHIAALFDEVEGMVPEAQLVQLFRLKYDYHNAKALIKARAMGVECDAILSQRGTVAPQKLLTAFLEEDYRDIPPVLAQAMVSAAAILARTMGIPAIIGAGDALQAEMEGKYAIIDGQTGEVVIEPDDAEREHLLKKQAKEKALKELLDQLKGKPNVTKDGRNVMVYCNIGSPADIDAVLQNDGGGIGLFRSEFLYLQGSDYPTEDEQFEAYKTVAERMGGRRVIIRTLDIGADKQADYFHLDKEENPAMGLRAIRICLTRPEVFRTQLRALYRASAYGKIAIMFPMITSVWEVQEIKRICRNIRAELAEEGVPMADKVELGIMIETPAAVMMSAELAREVDFFSVGTNDLTQYTLAVDRQGVGLDRFFDAHHPAVLRMLRMTAENAHRAGIWIGICGELGADAELTETFLSMGIDELSVSPSAVLPLRSAIRSIDMTTLAPLEL